MLNTPYNCTVRLGTLPDEHYKSPESAAVIAHELAARHAELDRLHYVEKLSQSMGYNTGCEKLKIVMEQRQHAHHKLSIIGYDNLRHLQAAGLTMAEISTYLGINQLDIMAFMSTHPDAVDHAQIDTVACADMKMAEFLKELEDSKPVTKYEADKLKVRLSALELLTKRLSPKWAAQMKDMQEVNTTIGVTFQMDLSGQIKAPVTRVAPTALNDDFKQDIDGSSLPVVAENT